jgi:hypothetical protein
VVRNELVSIVRRIKREARNNPAKAALLAGLLGLALYSWAPLVAGWLGAGEESPATASRSEKEQDEAAEFGSTPAAAQHVAVSDERPPWHELKEWKQDSPWTSPAELAGMRDPFRTVSGPEEPVDESEGVEEDPLTTPEQMVAGVDVQLTGTIVGPRRRVALLDGQAYREGDVLVVEHFGTTWELEIRRIEPNRVKLGWQSIERDLTAPERPPVGRIGLVGHSK